MSVRRKIWRNPAQRSNRALQDPLSTLTRSLRLEILEERALLAVTPPTAVDLQAGYDSGFYNNDNITKYTTLAFDVLGVQAGATVNVYRDTTLLGQVVASSTTASITLVQKLNEGVNGLTASQTVGGVESARSPVLNVTLDTTPPAPFSNTAPTVAYVEQEYYYDVQSANEGTFTYQLSFYQGYISGIGINPGSGIIRWTPTVAQIGTREFHIVGADLALNTYDQIVTVNVIDPRPLVNFVTTTQDAAENGQEITLSVQLSATFSQAVSIPFTLSGTASINDISIVTSSPISIPAGETTGAIKMRITDDVFNEGDETISVILGTPTNALLGVNKVHTVTILANDQFEVAALTPTSTGFVATFSQDLDPSVLNLYDLGGTSGSADLIFEGAASGVIQGTLIVDSGLRKVTFVRSGGILAPDSYTVRFRSATDAFKSAAGLLLKGNTTTAGTTYQVLSFQKSNPVANSVTLGVGEFARAPGQDVVLPGSQGVGIPIMLSGGVGISGTDFVLRYDPSLLTVTGAALGTGVNGSMSFQETSPGLITVSINSTTQLTSTPGPLTLLNLTAEVPVSASFGNAQALDLDLLKVYDDSAHIHEVPALDDDGIHLTALFGDANGDQSYNSPDATLLQRMIVGANSGLAAFPLVDPLVIGDITGDGNLQSNDVTLVQRAIVGIEVTEIPPLPSALQQHFAPASMAPEITASAAEVTENIGIVSSAEINHEIAWGLYLATVASSVPVPTGSVGQATDLLDSLDAVLADPETDEHFVSDDFNRLSASLSVTTKTRNALDAALEQPEEWLD